MKKYNIEMRKNCMEDFDNWIGDYTEAETEGEAIELVKQWLIDHGMDPEEIKEIQFRIRECEGWQTGTKYKIWEETEIEVLGKTLEECIEAIKRNGYMKNTITEPVRTRLAYASGYLEREYPAFADFLWKLIKGEDM